MENKKLSEHFELDEFIYSAGKKLKPTEDQVKVLQKLVDIFLEPLRVELKVPIKINSGLRTAETNKKIKENGNPASNTSDHLIPPKIITAEEFEKIYKNNIQNYIKDAQKKYANPIASGAADFCINTYPILSTFKTFVDCAEKFAEKFNQIIFYPQQNFIHISLARYLVYPFNLSSSSPVLIYRPETGYKYYDLKTLKKFAKNNQIPTN